MAAPQLNFERFNSTVNQTDLARSNLFSVVFGSKSIAAMTERGTNTFWDDRYTSYVEDIAASQSDIYNGIFESSRNSIVRGVAASDYFPEAGKRILNQLDARRLQIMAKAVQIPETAFTVTPNLLRGGVVQNVFNQRNIPTCTMTFYVGSDHLERLWFEDWMDMVHDQAQGTVGYADDYERQIEIYTYNRQGVAKSVTTLHRAFPTRVGMVQLDSDLSNEVTVIEVDFAFKRAVKATVSAFDANNPNIIEGALSDASSLSNLIS